MLIQGKLLSFGDDLTEALDIRRKVFVEEMNIPEDIEFNEFDDIATHVIVYEEDSDCTNTHREHNKIPVATGRIYYDGTECQIGHIAVIKEYRNKKYGDFAVRMLLNKAFTSGILEVSLIAQNSAIDFYKKIGFHTTGECFKEADVNFEKMVIRIDDVKTSCNRK